MPSNIPKHVMTLIVRDSQNELQIFGDPHLGSEGSGKSLRDL